ncbi:MAG: hypothetical protein ACK415_09090, partial [Thermodesulfovibrionales bacterium]
SLFLISNSESSEFKKNLIKVKESKILKARIGSDPDAIGVITLPEANPEGPMSFALSKNEEIYILDQINRRIQVFKQGKRIKTIPIPEETFIDIELLPGGKIVLLDSTVKKSVYIIDFRGKIINIIPLKGRLIPDVSLVAGIQVIEKGQWAGIWVNIDGRSVMIADHNGTEVERISVPGIFYQDGTGIFDVEKIGGATVTLKIYEKGSLSRFNSSDLFLNVEIIHIIGIGTDTNGKIYLGLFTDESENKTEKLSNYIVIINSGLQEIGRFKLDLQKTSHEIWRPIRISADGYVYQLVVNKHSVYIKKFEP